MKETWIVLRSIVLWLCSWLNFAVSVPLMLLTVRLVGHRRADPIMKQMARNICICAGVRVRCELSDQWDAGNTYIYVCNHVNMFDPFVLYAAIPQLYRGLEFESHFRKPVYGTFMKGIGNVPVPDDKNTGDLKNTFRLMKQRLGDGISMLGFAEGSRTADGRVNAFQDGIFMMAKQFKVPLVPISMIGAFHFKQKGSWKLRPATVHIRVHDPIDLANVPKADIPRIREQVREIIAAPVHAHLDSVPHAWTIKPESLPG